MHNFYQYLKNNIKIEEDTLNFIIDLTTIRKVKKHELLLTKGDICQHTFFINHGLLRFYSIDESGKEHIIQFAPENWFLSDRTSLYLTEPTAYFIDAIEDAEICLLAKNFTDQASLVSESFRIYHEKLLQTHIMQLQNRINLLIGAPAIERYVAFIKLYPDLVQRVPQWMVASYLGITPESLSRVRKEISEKKSMI